MGRTEKRELISRLSVLLLHLLKWRYQPEKRSPSWEASIRVQRNRLADHLDDNPSLKSLLPQALASAYRDAALEAVAETGLAGAAFPAACPWTVEQVLDRGFWPGYSPFPPSADVCLLRATHAVDTLVSCTFVAYTGSRRRAAIGHHRGVHPLPATLLLGGAGLGGLALPARPGWAHLSPDPLGGACRSAQHFPPRFCRSAYIDQAARIPSRRCHPSFLDQVYDRECGLTVAATFAVSAIQALSFSFCLVLPCRPRASGPSAAICSGPRTSLRTLLARTAAPPCCIRLDARARHERLSTPCGACFKLVDR